MLLVVGDGYIIVQPQEREGIGSRLLQLGQAVWLGRELGRTVIVDWRGTVFLKDKGLNYFTEVFAALPEILGVPMDYAPSPATREYEQTRESERLNLTPDVLAEIGSEPGSAPPVRPRPQIFARARRPAGLRRHELRLLSGGLLRSHRPTPGRGRVARVVVRREPARSLRRGSERLDRQRVLREGLQVRGQGQRSHLRQREAVSPHDRDC